MPPPLGGTTVLLDYLVKELSLRDDVCCSVINVSGFQFKLPLFIGIRRAVLLIVQLGMRIRQVDVLTLHAATTSLHITGLILLAFSKVFKKPLIIRKFAGTDYNELSLLKRNLIRFVVQKSDLFLLETKYLINRAQLDGCHNVRWFPNHRPIREIQLPQEAQQRKCRHFVYLGHVRPDKGIRELIAASERLAEGATIDVYGSFMDGLSEDIFISKKNIRYCGIVQPERVHDMLQQYDAMVFPTYHDGEGHPGVVLEAYIAGLPVISTKWKSVPEVVDDSVGILVEPKNVEQLLQAMLRLSEDTAFYQQLRSNTRQKSIFYSSQRWADELVTYCREIV